MQKVSRTFDQKRQTIVKIQGRRQHRERPNLSQQQQELVLPSLALTPATKIKQSHIFTATISAQFKNSIENELDSIINDTLSNFRHQKINKIIFASPITNRLGKTYYRSNNQSIYEVNKPKNHQYKRYSTLDPPERSLNSSLIGTHKPIEPAYGLNLHSHLISDHQNSDQFSGYGEFKASKALNNQRFLRNELRRGKKKQKQKRSDRFSPWRDNQGEDELL